MAKSKLKLQVGGTVDPRRHLYVIREDVENAVFRILTERDYCNIFSPRQAGKSSLMRQIAQRLKDQGIRVAPIDVAGELGSPGDAAMWYQGFLKKIAHFLGMTFDVEQWWDKQKNATINQRLLDFFRLEVFATDDSPAVIFVDEIEHSLNLTYTDDLFTAIRTMYNARSAEPVFDKLTFCLVGVAHPGELVKRRRSAPYNVGQTVELRDFDAADDDLGMLIKFLCSDAVIGKQLLEAVLYWTDGHPFLTMWLCSKIREKELRTAEDVSRFVQETFSDRELLPSEVGTHFEQMERFAGDAKLSGLKKRDKAGNFVVRNRIYQCFFGPQPDPHERTDHALMQEAIKTVEATTGDSTRPAGTSVVRDHVFISYAHADCAWLSKFQTHLTPYSWQDKLVVWDDTRIAVGADWRKEIQDALASASVAVLLVSPNFLASDFIAKHELPPLLKAAEKEGVTIVWVPISASSYKVTPLAGFQPAHAPDKPLNTLDPAQQDVALVGICEKVAAAYGRK